MQIVLKERSEWSRFVGLFGAFGLVLAPLGLAASHYRKARAEGVSVDHLIVSEQIRRVAEKSADIALFGDSSCLMGIDALRLSHISSRKAEGFCTIAYVGPAGIARMIDRMRARPERLILAFHPASFARDPSWEQWAVIAGSPPEPLPRGDALLTFLDGLIGKPLPGPYGEFYGPASGFIGYIRDHNGSAIDPSWGRGVSSRSELEALPHLPTRWGIVPYTFNEAFDKALALLAERIEGLGRERFYVLVMPVPDAAADERTAGAKIAAERHIAALLGLPESHILPMPATLPYWYFSSSTHLNRWGQELYTEELASVLTTAGF